VFFTELGIPIRADVGILEADDLRTGHRPRTRMLLTTTETESNPVLSPNGRWLAHWWNPGSGPPYRIYVRPYPDVNALRIPVAAGTHPAWTLDGRQLLFVDQEGYLTAVDMPIRDGRPEPGTPVRLLDAPYFAGGPLATGRPYEVLPDGRVLMIKEISQGAGNAVVVQNWFEELKRLARGD
jgi:hypothetical protein